MYQTFKSSGMLRCTVSLGEQLLRFRRIGDTFRTLGIIYLVTLCKIREDLNLQRACCNDLKSLQQAVCCVITSASHFVNLGVSKDKTSLILCYVYRKL